MSDVTNSRAKRLWLMFGLLPAGMVLSVSPWLIAAPRQPFGTIVAGVAFLLFVVSAVGVSKGDGPYHYW